MAGFLSALLLAWGAIRWLGPRGFLDVPGGRKQHGRPVPRVGGIALVLALILGKVMGWFDGLLTPPEWGAVLTMACMGAIDDRFSLRARWKALLGLVVACFLAWIQLGTFLPHASHLTLVGIPLPTNPWFIAALLVALYWAVPQSYNLIDGADGLALGCALIVVAVLGLSGNPRYFFLGALAALFVLNWPRARCFLGDCGSLLVGLQLALLAAKTFGPVRPDAILWVFAYPLADVSMVILIRFATRQPVLRGDRNHLHHHWGRLLGSCHQGAVPILWVSMALCASGAVLGEEWAWIPRIGLVALGLQVFGFATHAILRHHRARRPGFRGSRLGDLIPEGSDSGGIR